MASRVELKHEVGAKWKARRTPMRGKMVFFFCGCICNGPREVIPDDDVLPHMEVNKQAKPRCTGRLALEEDYVGLLYGIGYGIEPRLNLLSV
jgi:hypothetical protein